MQKEGSEVEFFGIIQKKQINNMNGTTCYNSRLSLSSDSVLDLDLDRFTIDQILGKEFDEITYAIRLETPVLDQQQRLQSEKEQQRLENMPSNTIVIQLQDNSFNFQQPNNSHQLNRKIPQIRLSSQKYLPSVADNLMTMMLILTSDKQINQIKIYLNDSRQNQQITNYQQRYKYKDIYIVTCLLHVKINQFKNLSVKYKETMKSYLIIRSKMDKQIELSQTKVYQNIGILFNELNEEEINIELVNFCILAAQQTISKKIRQLVLVNPRIVSEFYQMLAQYFRPYDPKIGEVYARFEPSKTSIYVTQFFLCFFYKIYREDAINKLYEFKMIDKLSIYRGCSKVLSTKYYQIFDNGQCFKEFILYAYFLIATSTQKDNIELLRSVVKYNILHQNELQVTRILLKIQSLPEKVLLIFNSRQVNAKISTNKQISFEDYFYLRIRALNVIIKQEEKDAEPDQKAISLETVSFFSHLIEKAKNKTLQNQEKIYKYRQFVKTVLLNKGRLRITDKDFPQIYAKIKFLNKLAQPVSNMILSIIQEKIFSLIPSLLKSSYEGIIHALILKPQLAEQNKILIDHFQSFPIKTSQIVFLIKIWLEMKKQLYNYLTIQFVILKFMAVNRSFLTIDLSEITKTFIEYTKTQLPSENKKKQMSNFCQKMIHEMQDHEGKEQFEKWESSFFQI